jgi:methionine synthase II (cobalamin-independent)
MPRTKPPFRADHVGSFLRPAALHEARAKREKGEIDAAALKAVEDREIEKIVKKQEEIGLQLATDGEFRRSWWHYDFLTQLDGMKMVKTDHALQFRGMTPRAEAPSIVGKIGFSSHPMLEHFKFLKSKTKVTPKMTIPSPAVLHFRLTTPAIKKVYPDLGEFFADAAKSYADALRAFYDAGCRYLQLDDTVWAYLCSDEQLAQAKARGEDTDKLAGWYVDCINASVKNKPADMTVTMHICRGNFRSTWISEGGYGPVAESVLGKLNIDGYFLEYDSDRAGGFEPLRHLPKGNKMVVVGLITSKAGKLETKDEVKKRLDEAAKFAPMDQLCLSPQCGFASTEEGNELTEDEQWAKLSRVVEIAREVWG